MSGQNHRTSLPFSHNTGEKTKETKTKSQKKTNKETNKQKTQHVRNLRNIQMHYNKTILTSAVNQMNAATDTVIAVILNLSAFLLPLNSLDGPHLQSSNVTHKLPARALFSFKSSNGFVTMDLPRGKLCSHFSKMKELKSVHSWIHFKNKLPTRQNITKESRVTEDFSDRKLHAQPQRVLCTFLPFVVF